MREDVQRNAEGQSLPYLLDDSDPRGDMRTIDVWRIVTLPEAAKRAKVEPGTLRMYRLRHDDFPKPFLAQGRVNLYDWLAISDWLTKNAPYGRYLWREEAIENLRVKAREGYYRSRGLPIPLEEPERHDPEHEEEPKGDPDRGQEQGHPEEDHQRRIAI